MSATIETAAALRARLCALGIPAVAIAEAVRATAPARHAARVEAARAAAEAATRAVLGPHVDPELVALGGRLLALLELVGVGGHAGLEGAATARAPWARALGKGRRQASDGAAWDAALREVAGGLDVGVEFRREGDFRLALGERILVPGEAIDLDVASGGRLETLARLAVRASMGEARATARLGIAGEGLLHGPWDGPPAERERDLPAWGVLLAALVSAREGRTEAARAALDASRTALRVAEGELAEAQAEAASPPGDEPGSDVARRLEGARFRSLEARAAFDRAAEAAREAGIDPATGDGPRPSESEARERALAQDAAARAVRS